MTKIHKSSKQYFCPARDKQSGISLIEVLVTVLIIAIGGLGVASLQLAGLKYSSGSYARTQTILLADDMANRIKSNRAFALDFGENDEIGDASPYDVPDYRSSGVINVDCGANACTRAEVAAYDIATWLNEIARVLPAGEGQIVSTDLTNDANTELRYFDISMRWRQVANSSTPTGNDDDELQTVTYRITI